MTEENYNIKYTVDTCGHCCPIPMISTLKVLSRMNVGDRIEIKATDDAFEVDIQKVADMGKCKVLLSEEREEYMYFIVEKI